MNPANPWRKDWTSYTPVELGEAFYVMSQQRRKGGLTLYDQTGLFDPYQLAGSKDERSIQGGFYLYTVGTEDELLDLYGKVQPGNYDLCFIVLHNAADAKVKARVKVHRNLEKMMPLKDGQSSTAVDLEFAADWQQVVGKNGLSARAILSLLGLTPQKKPTENVEQDMVMDEAPPFNAGLSNTTRDGKKVYSHGDIELEGLEGIFSREEIIQVYYGNWLRDFSQINVGLIISPIHDNGPVVANMQTPFSLGENALKDLGHRMTIEGLTGLIELIGAAEFSYEKRKKLGRGLPYSSFRGYLDEFRKTYGALTRDILGCYRPEEHIDNPKGLADDSVEDGKYGKVVREYATFQYEYAPGKFKKNYLYSGEYAPALRVDVGSHAMDPNNPRGLKQYIIKDHFVVGNKEYKIPYASLPPEMMRTARPAATTFVKQQIALAVASGKGVKGFRHLGAALHVLEDYFAHTNFVEVSLIKLGRTKIFPWVETVAETNNNVTTPKTDVELKNEAFWVVKEPFKSASDPDKIEPLAKHIPIVTGVFLADDTAASVLPKISSAFDIKIDPYHQLKEGERTFNDLLIMMVLEDFANAHARIPADDRPTYGGFTAQTWLDSYTTFLSAVDSWRHFRDNYWFGFVLTIIEIPFHYLFEVISMFTAIAIHMVFDPMDEVIKELQNLIGGDVGTDPTHTQLAKDALNHPLNPLAGKLAVMAVRDVGQRMYNAWTRGTMTGSALGEYVVNTYFVHPCKAKWMDIAVKEWIDDQKNGDALFRSESKSLVEHLVHVLGPIWEERIKPALKGGAEIFEKIKELDVEIQKKIAEKMKEYEKK